MQLPGAPFRTICLAILLASTGAPQRLLAQASSPATSSSAKHAKKPPISADSELDAGSVKDGVYHSAKFGFSCKIPDGWVLRTEEMNDASRAAQDRTAEGGCPHTCSTVLLAAFSRPPEAKGEEVNSSLLIVAESAATYPGLKEAVQYFGPLTEVAKAQGFAADGDPYEIAIGAKTLVRGDFQKDVGTRVMRQSTLVMLSHGYAVSLTFIAGTQDEVEGLVDGLDFAGVAKK